MTRALVLGGGGPVGIAWETGLLAGLIEGGVAVDEADYILGTSAGSAVGAQVALGRPLSEQVERQRMPPAARPASERAAKPPDLAPLLAIMMEAATSEAPRQSIMQRIGSFALEAETPPEDRWIESFRTMMGSEEWPERAYACTAVDAESGEFVVWSQDSGVDLVRAVASSCAVPGIFPPVTINGRRYIDGGMRSSTNADLASGHDLVLLVAVMSRRPPPVPAMAEAARARLEGEIERLRSSGGRVELVRPDDVSSDAFGPNMMDGSRRPEVVDAGLAQGRAAAAELGAVWDEFGT